MVEVEPIDMPEKTRPKLRLLWSEKKEIEKNIEALKVQLAMRGAALKAYHDGVAAAIGVPEDWIFEHQEMRWVSPKSERGSLESG